MKKLIALLLLLSIFFSSSCSNKGGSDKNGDINSPDAGNGGNTNTDTPELTIVVPEYKDYQRGTVDFDKLIYSRPDMQSLIDSFVSVSSDVTENVIPVSEQIEKMRSLEATLSNTESMYSLAQIYNNKDFSVEYWQTEYEYISTNYPKLSQSVEDLLVACARSEHRYTFEDEYFGYSLTEYVEGGIYTDEVVALMAEEARLESEYTSISTATVEITYNSVNANIRWSGTVDEVIAKAKEYFGDDEASFERCLMVISSKYEIARKSVEEPIFLDLLRVRRLIADALGYDSYSELAYRTMGYDYSPEEMYHLLKNIGKYVSPVANELKYEVFDSYFNTNVQARVDHVAVINTLYQVYSELGGDYADAYSYMLQHGLYDVSTYGSNRYSGAFTAYVTDNASPYLFMTSSGFIRDYTTLAHEFGHFLDGYVNYGVDESLAMSEISSQAFELLTLTKLKNNISARNYSYLEYYSMYTFLGNVLLEQSFFSAFEHLVYQLEYDDITGSKVLSVIADAYELVFGEEIGIEPAISDVAIVHTFLYPFYVESYVTSGIVSLDIFFLESSRTGRAGDGFAVYDQLIHRGEMELGFVERLESVGLDSPFKPGKTKNIAENIYFQITGKSYYKVGNNDIGAA